jgi:hypothetical protein
MYASRKGSNFYDWALIERRNLGTGGWKEPGGWSWLIWFHHASRPTYTVGDIVGEILGSSLCGLQKYQMAMSFVFPCHGQLFPSLVFFEFTVNVQCPSFVWFAVSKAQKKSWRSSNYIHTAPVVFFTRSWPCCCRTDLFPSTIEFERTRERRSYE